MPLQDMLDAAAQGGTVEVEQGWTQGRTVYGGLSGALLLSAAKGRLEEPVPLRSITVSFISPVTPGPVEIDAEVLRAGSNVTQCRATLRRDGAVVALALASFGRHRESAITVEPAHRMPELPDPSTIETIPSMDGLTPEFFQFVDLRLVHGNWPGSGADTSSTTGWMSFRDTPERFDEEHLAALTDAWPTPVIQMLPAFAPVSTLTWTLEMVDEVGSGAGGATDGRFAYEVETDAARHGYAHTHAMVWSPDGTLVAISRQTVTVFG